MTSPPERTEWEIALARAVLRIADAAGMPDTYWSASEDIRKACDVLGVPADGRYSHEHLWG